MDKERVRAWWWKRQGLDGSLTGESCEHVLVSTGWAHSVGGSNPYFTLRSRGGCSRETVDAALASVGIQELPCARGRTYVVPAGDCELALQAGAPFCDSEMQIARKLGVTDSEIDRLSLCILDALQAGRTELGDVRSFSLDSPKSRRPRLDALRAAS